MHACHAVDKVIFGKHDFGDAAEQLRLIFLHPQKFGGCKSRKGDVGGALAEHAAPYRAIQISCLLRCASVVP